jgi:hypothetical protein
MRDTCATTNVAITLHVVASEATMMPGGNMTNGDNLATVNTVGPILNFLSPE